MTLLPGNTWTEVVYNIIVIYLALTLVLTLYLMGRMHIIKFRACNSRAAKLRIARLQSEGRYVQIPVYDLQEMEHDKSIEDVRLMYFPNDTGERRKFVMLIPGGGYGHCVCFEDAYPAAAAINAMGYSAFVLEYRVGRKCTPFGPMEDLGRALKLIESQQERFNVTMEGYALMGFSAGGNLAGIFSSSGKHGYSEFGVSKPGATILAYPWTSVNDWLHHPYWNIWIGIIGVILSLRGNYNMFGIRHRKEGKGALDVCQYIDADYPPTYMWSGSWDILVPASRHADMFEQALKANGVKYIYQKYFGLPHGIGVAYGTKGEGWLKESLEFWEENLTE